MKIVYGFLLIMLLSPAGCAPGYYETRPALGEEASGYYETKAWYRNPETWEGQTMRIWREDSQR